jgi:hypothetical protein
MTTSRILITGSISVGDLIAAGPAQAKLMELGPIIDIKILLDEAAALGAFVIDPRKVEEWKAGDWEVQKGGGKRYVNLGSEWASHPPTNLGHNTSKRELKKMLGSARQVRKAKKQERVKEKIMAEVAGEIKKRQDEEMAQWVGMPTASAVSGRVQAGTSLTKGHGTEEGE